MEVYKQFINRELLDFFIADQWEIVRALKKMRGELINFKMHLEGLFMLIFRLLQKNQNLKISLKQKNCLKKINKTILKIYKEKW